MTTTLSSYIQRVEGLRKDLNKVKSTQLQSQLQRSLLRALVEEYFSSIRQSIIGNSENDPLVSVVDSHMQELLLLCHKKGTVKKYKDILTKVKSGLITLDSRMVAVVVNSKPLTKVNSTDVEILKTLDQIVPSASLSYRQALEDLNTENRTSWRGPATELREALRETLDHLAPDAEVKGMPGYVQAKETNGPTMKQKVRYILKKRGLSNTLTEPAENATETVDTIVGTFVRSVYTRSNVSTHTPTDKNEVLRLRDFVRVILSELLEIRL